MPSNVTYEYIKQNPDVMTYIRYADAAVGAQGFTEHSFAHVEKVAASVKMIMEGLGCPSREVELGMIAAYLHDIGNVINRDDHAQSGAVMAFKLLSDMNMPADEICKVIAAIGNHDEATAQPLNRMCSALIIADKTDVRRSRVRSSDEITFDIHDRVNYAVTESSLKFNEDKTALVLDLTIDNEISSVMEYFEIFMNRMLLCRRSAERLGVSFRMTVNGSVVI